MTPDTGSDTPVTDTPDTKPRLKWAYFGAGLGAVVSIAANVAHSFVPPAELRKIGGKAMEAWGPHAGAVIGAVFWPVALLVALEIIARTDWPAGRRWVVIRFGGLVPVAVVAAVVSYRHMSGLLAYYGEDRLTSAIGPLAVDGLMVMAAGAVIAVTRRDARLAVTPDTAGAGDAAQPPAPAATTDIPATADRIVTDIRRGRRARRGGNGSATDKAARARQLRDTKGMTAPEIAAELGVSERTVWRYLEASDSPDTDADADPEAVQA
jgi:hypothetical protein